MARSFNGSSDLITIGSGFVGNGSFPVSFSVWVLNNNVMTQTPILGGGGNALILEANWTGAATYFGLSANGTATLNNFLPGDVSGVWCNVICTYDGTTAIGYTNGAPSSSAASHSLTPSVMTIGNLTTSFFTGSIADVAFWNVILTQAEATALASGVRPTRIRPQALTGYWPLDGLQSPEPDLSGNKNNGTLTGTALASGPPTALLTPRAGRFILTAGAGPSAATPIFPSAPLGGVLRRFRIAA